MKKLREEQKQEIRRAFGVMTGCGVPEEALARMLADHAIGLLELSDEITHDWYETEKPAA